MKAFDLDMTYEMPAEIRQQKNVSYTITPIGGKKELLEWRQAQALKAKERKAACDEAYQMKRAFLAYIAKGQAKGSKYVEPATFGRYRAEITKLAAKPTVFLADKACNGALPLHDITAPHEPPVVKWYEKIKKALTFNL